MASFFGTCNQCNHCIYLYFVFFLCVCVSFLALIRVDLHCANKCVTQRCFICSVTLFLHGYVELSSTTLELTVPGDRRIVAIENTIPTIWNLENQTISPFSAKKNHLLLDENARKIFHIFFEWEEIISILCLGRSLEHFVSLKCTFTDFLY